MAGAMLEAVTKSFGATRVIHGVDLEIDDGAFCVFVGPSGCGKSTLLRMIAGLEQTTSGRIRIGDVDVTHAEPSERGVAMVFQSYALYPHMSVEQNMGFGLKMTGHAADEVRERVQTAANVLKLGDYLKRKPKALSGGQRQRVAIGRAIVRDPKIFLFDEPLSNLDAELRVEMRVEIARLHQEIGATMIYVTHDQVEAMTLADKIVVLRAGRIEQAGKPMDLFDDPDSRFVAGFIGTPSMNFLDAAASGGELRIEALDATLRPSAAAAAASAVTAGVRPNHLRLTPNGALTVDLVERLGGSSLIYLIAPTGERLTIETPERDIPAPGAQCGVAVDPTHVFLFDPATEQRIR